MSCVTIKATSVKKSECRSITTISQSHAGAVTFLLPRKRREYKV